MGTMAKMVPRIQINHPAMLRAWILGSVKTKKARTICRISKTL